MWELLKASLQPPIFLLRSLPKWVQSCPLLQMPSVCQYLQIHLYPRRLWALTLKSNYGFHISTRMSQSPNMSRRNSRSPPLPQTGVPPGFPTNHTSHCTRSGICKSSLSLLSSSSSRAYTLPSPTGFACGVCGDFDSFPPLRQHLPSHSFWQLSSGLAIKSLLPVLLKSTFAPLFCSFFIPKAPQTT